MANLFHFKLLIGWCLHIVPKNQFQTHLRTLASIAKFLNDRSVRESLAEAKSADEILSIFRDRSQKL